MIYAILIGIACAIAGYFLKNSIKNEWLENKKYKFPALLIAVAFGFIGSFNAGFYPIFGIFMYWWGNLV